MKKSIISGMLLALASGCGGDGSGSQEPGTTAPPPAPPAQPLSKTISVASAAGLGVNVIVHLGPGENLTGCTVTRIATGETEEVGPAECNALVPAPGEQGDYCQVLLRGVSIASIEPSRCNPMVEDGQILPTADGSATHAATNAQATLDYYKSHFKRDGLDDQGSEVTSIVHVGLSLANAYFARDLGIMLYGDGDGKTLRDTTQALDAAGHEMTHAVTESTAHLAIRDEPGALNEATSDLFGELIEGRFDWKIAEDITIGKPGLRDLANPASLTGQYRRADGSVADVPFPAHMRDYYTVPSGEPCSGANDNCWVHLNSTIVGHALYLLDQRLGHDKAEQVYYLALTQYFGPTTDFQGAADETISACQQLYDQATCESAATAFADVGLEPQASAG